MKVTVELNKRELEIAEMLWQGMLYKEIGYKLGVSRTRTYQLIVTLYDKLGCTDRFSFIRFAVRNKMVR